MSGWPPSNYASIPAPSGGAGAWSPGCPQQGKGVAAFGTWENVHLVVWPSLVSVVVYALFANWYQQYRMQVLVVLALLLLGSGLLCLRPPAPLARYVCAITFVATILSASIGQVSHQMAFSHYWRLEESNAYSNVLATESAAGFADAGKLVFADGTRVDAGRALGYKDGKTYCVAPIIDEMMNGAVEFWAVGIDCCSVRGTFWCDDAWNVKARSGIVVDDPTGDFSAASRQAEAAFEIAASTKPMFVRWVVDPEQVQLNYRMTGVSILVVAGIVQALLLVFATMGLNTTMKGPRSLFR